MNFFKRWLKRRRDKNCNRQRHYWAIRPILHNPIYETTYCTNCGAKYLTLKRRFR